MKPLTKITLCTIAAFAQISAANAQMRGPQPSGYGAPQPQKQHASDSAYYGVRDVSPQTAALFTNTTYREVEGQMMAVAEYAPDGRCRVIISSRSQGGQKMTTQSCRYVVRDLGPGRIGFAAKATINGQTISDHTTLRIRPDGSMIDEKTRTVSQRIK